MVVVITNVITDTFIHLVAFLVFHFISFNIKGMEALGNLKAKEKYEVQVPACYRIPTCEDVQ